MIMTYDLNYLTEICIFKKPNVTSEAVPSDARPWNLVVTAPCTVLLIDNSDIANVPRH